MLLDGVMRGDELAGLIAASDVYVSLHRSEGFGRPIAEAILLGVPAIVTDWSGTRDFIDEYCGFPIKFSLRSVGVNEYPLAIGDWAEPDVLHAAQVMRLVYEHPSALETVRNRGSCRIRSTYGREAVARKIKAAISELILQLDARQK